MPTDACAPYARRRAGRFTTGAAVLEAVVVLPAFVIVFACLMFVSKIYVAKTAVMYETKERAWTAAIGSCSGTGVSASTLEPPSLGALGAPAGAIQTLQGLPGADTMSKSFGSVTATSTRDVTPDAIVGGNTKHMIATVTVMCNEDPQNGDLKGVAKAAWSALTRW